MRWFAVLLALIILLGVLLNTRLGIFIIFDVFGDVGSDNLELNSETGPLKLSDALAAADTIILPEYVEQASGIHVDTDAMFIGTDQAELFQFDRSGTLIKQFDFLSGPLLFKQGSVESIYHASNKIYVIGELGYVGIWEKQTDKWHELEPLALPTAFAEAEFTGLTMFDGRLLATTEDVEHIYDLTNNQLITLDYSSFLKPDETLTQLMISGISHDDMHVYLVTESYASIIKIDPQQWTVNEVFDIDDIEASDIAIHDGRAYVTADHNYFDVRPPVMVYNLAKSLF